MTLYEKAIELSDKIAYLEEAKEFLEAEGFQVIGSEMPNLRNRLFDLMDHYPDNAVVQRIKNREDLGEITQEILSQRNYSLKLPWKRKEREEYNQRVEELAEVLPSAKKLKRKSLFSWGNDEHLIPLFGAIGFLIPEYLRFLRAKTWKQEYRLFQNPLETGIITLGFVAVGAFLSYDFQRSELRRINNSLKKEIEFLNRVLGNREEKEE